MRRQLCASNMGVIHLDLQVTRMVLVAEQSMDWEVGWSGALIGQFMYRHKRGL